MKSFPLEMQDNVIDELFKIAQRGDFLRLRLVCCNWRLRVDFHAFQIFRMELREGPEALSTIKASNCAILQCIRELHISENEWINEGPSEVPCYDDALLQDYLEDLVRSLPRLQLLRLSGLNPWHAKVVPSFPTVKHLTFLGVSFHAPEYHRLLSASRSLETVYHHGSTICIPPDNAVGGRLRRPLHLTNLKSYHGTLSRKKSKTALLEGLLFPKSISAPLPSLTHLSLWIIEPRAIETLVRLMEASQKSLRYLLLSCRAELNTDEIDTVQNPFDFSKCKRLEYVEFRNIVVHSRNLALAATSLETLPTDGGNILVCLRFSDEVTESCSVFKKVDAALANHIAVKKVVITGRSDRDKDRKRIEGEFALLAAQGKLWVGESSETWDIIGEI